MDRSGSTKDDGQCCKVHWLVSFIDSQHERLYIELNHQIGVSNYLCSPELHLHVCISASATDIRGGDGHLDHCKWLQSQCELEYDCLTRLYAS